MNLTCCVIGLLMICLIWGCPGAGAEEGAITKEMLESFRASVTMNSDTRARLNAISNNNVNELALNRAHQGQINDLFDYKIETGGITNQKSSGRCWLFTSLNVLRPHVMKKYNLESFEFSETYNFLGINWRKQIYSCKILFKPVNWIPNIVKSNGCSTMR